MIAQLLLLATLQQSSLGPTVTVANGIGEGVERSCLQRGYFSGVGLRFVTPVLTRATLQVQGRGYGIGKSASCVDGFPPPDGVYIEDDRVDILSRPFVTTDVRLAIGVAQNVMTLAAGAGKAWHDGYDLPYVVVAVAWRLVDKPGVRFGFGGEHQWLRASADRYRRTYQNFQRVDEVALGRVTNWSRALVLSVNLDFPL